MGRREKKKKVLNSKRRTIALVGETEIVAFDSPNSHQMYSYFFSSLRSFFVN